MGKMIVTDIDLTLWFDKRPCRLAMKKMWEYQKRGYAIVYLSGRFKFPKGFFIHFPDGMNLLRTNRFLTPHLWKMKKLGELRFMGSDVEMFFDDNPNTVRGTQAMGVNGIHIDGQDRWRDI